MPLFCWILWGIPLNLEIQDWLSRGENPSNGIFDLRSELREDLRQGKSKEFADLPSTDAGKALIDALNTTVSVKEPKANGGHSVQELQFQELFLLGLVGGFGVFFGASQRLGQSSMVRDVPAGANH